MTRNATRRGATPRRALSCGAAILTVLLAAGCRTGGGWTPAEPAAYDRLPAASEGRWGSTTQVRFGGYTADSVKISWARGGGGGVRVGRLGTERADSRQDYRFLLQTTGGTRLSVMCHSSARVRDVGLRSIELRASASYSYDCDIHPAAGSALQLSLREEADEGFAGSITLDGARLTLHTQLTGNRVTGRRADAYEVRDGENVIATIEPRSRVVWLARRAPAAWRDAGAAAAVALLLYQRPTQ